MRDAPDIAFDTLDAQLARDDARQDAIDALLGSDEFWQRPHIIAYARDMCTHLRDAPSNKDVSIVQLRLYVNRITAHAEKAIDDGND